MNDLKKWQRFYVIDNDMYHSTSHEFPSNKSRCLQATALIDTIS